MEKDFKVVSEQGIKGLETEVKALLGNGWRLHGNLVVNAIAGPQGKGIILYTQVMVK